MSKKTTAIPDSDEMARKKHPLNEDAGPEPEENLEGRQTSLKSGKHSSVEKLAASRPEFGESPGAHPVPGADGDPAKDAPPRGSLPRDKAHSHSKHES